MTERVKASRIAELLGISVRQVQSMAAQGKIPSAAQFGKMWTFREPIVQRWIRLKERKSWRGTSTNAARNTGRDSRWTASNVAKAYEQFMSQRRGNGSAS